MPLQVHSYQSLRGDELRYGLLVPADEPASNNVLNRKPMVFFPGLGGSVKNALVFFNALLPAAAPIYVPDLRGFGLNDSHTLPEPSHFVAEARHFINTVVLARHVSPVVVGGISLGAALATRLFQWPEVTEHAHKLLLVAPAYREHPKTFPLPIVAKTALSIITQGADALIRLPYTLSDLTRNEAVLNDPRHQEHMDTFRLPMRFAWQLRQFNRGAIKALNAINVPSCIVVPEQDTVCCPRAMKSSHQQLARMFPSTLLTYPEARHDIFLEPEVLTLAGDVCHWLARS